MSDCWNTEAVFLSECSDGKSENVKIEGAITEKYDIKGASKLGEYSQTKSFDSGFAEITHSVAKINSAHIFMPNGFVVVDERLLVKESTWQSAIHKRSDVIVNNDTRWQHHIKRPVEGDIIHVEKEGILFAYHRFNYQYFHWFIDCLPRLWLAREQNMDFSEFYCGEFNENSFQQRSIDLLGFEGQKLSFGAGGKVLRFNSLLYPFSTLKESLKVRPSFRDGVHHKGGWHPSYLIDINQRITLRAASKNVSRGTRLYVKRPQSGHRRLLNSDVFESFLDENGFCTVDPGQHTFASQVQMFHEAEFIVGVHGAGLTNLLWTNPKRLRGVFEITVDSINDTGYTFISSGLGLRHYVFPATPIQHKHGPAFADLVFDQIQAVRALKSILQE
jgi:capsular polysaccharide biosynthesis protein